MASVQTRYNSGEYYAFFRDASGRRTSRNTGTRNKREALRIAKQWEMEVKEAQNLSQSPAAAFTPPEPVRTWTEETETLSTPQQTIIWHSRMLNRPRHPETLEDPKRAYIQAGHGGSKEERRAILTEWDKFYDHRVLILKDQVKAFKRFNAQEDRIVSALPPEIAWQSHPEIMRLREVPTPAQHAATVRIAWINAIEGKEKAVWGKIVRSPSGDLIAAPLGKLELHSVIPQEPTVEEKAELVVIIRDPQGLAGELKCESHTELSALKRLEECHDDLNLPEYSFKILDQPFQTLELFKEHIESMLPKEDDEPLSRTQEWRILKFQESAAKCELRALSLFTDEPADVLLRGTAWLALISQFISTTMAWAEAKRTLNEGQERRAKANMKMDARRGKGRGKDGGKAEIVRRLVSVLTSNPNILAKECLAFLEKEEVLKETSDGLLVFPGQLRKPIKPETFAKWVTEAHKKLDD